MKPSIKKGDKFLCIKDYVMYDHTIAYKKGNTYTAISYDNIPSEGCSSHDMSNEEDFYEYFELIKNVDIEGTISVSNTQAMRFNSDKPQYSLLDLNALEPTVRVLEFGAKKYARENWQKGLQFSEVLDSLMRHIKGLQAGEWIDPESGLPHIGHIGCNAMFLGSKTNIMNLDKLKEQFEQWKQS